MADICHLDIYRQNNARFSTFLLRGVGALVNQLTHRHDAGSEKFEYGVS